LAALQRKVSLWTTEVKRTRAPRALMADSSASLSNLDPLGLSPSFSLSLSSHLSSSLFSGSTGGSESSGSGAEETAGGGPRTRGATTSQGSSASEDPRRGESVDEKVRAEHGGLNLRVHDVPTVVSCNSRW
jgi:hypothetical protein